MMARRRKPFFEIIFEVFILLFLIPLFFNLSFLTGIFYIVAVFSVFYNRTIFRKKGIARLVVVGSILTYIAGLIFFYGLRYEWNSVMFVLLFLLSLYVWFKGRKMKKGKR